MIGRTHIYKDSEHLKMLLDKLRESGIEINPIDKTDLESYSFRSGLGRVYGSIGFGDVKTSIYFGFGHPFNPFLWFSDSKLLKQIQDVLLSNGSDKIKYETQNTH